MLVDEINRAMPKTQSALLEAMAEQQVTVDGVTRPLPDPFLVLATENPIEHEGTFPLPEAQLDRFFLRTSLGYPGAEDELRDRATTSATGIRSTRSGRSSRSPRCAALQRAVEDVYVDPLIAALDRSTSSAPPASCDGVAIGASVRGSLALERAARAWALLDGRDYVTPEDVEQLFLPVLGTGIVFTPTLPRRGAPDRLRRRARALPRACLERAPRPDPEALAAVSPSARTTYATGDLTFPLVPRRRLLGLAFGAMHSARRGLGSDVAGSRPYQPGDDVGRDRLGRVGAALVGARHGRVRRPRALRRGGAARRGRRATAGPRWRSSPRAAVAAQAGGRCATRSADRRDSARGRAGSLGYFDDGGGASRSGSRRAARRPSTAAPERLDRGGFAAPADTLERALRHLDEHAPRPCRRAASSSSSRTSSRRRPARRGSRALERRWDIVPVVIQDPVWEQSFPDVSGAVVPFARRPATGAVTLVRIPADECAARRDANERRHAELVRGLRALDLDPVVVSSHDRKDIVFAFLTWADQRLFTRGRA